MSNEERKKLNKEYRVTRGVIENAVAVGSFIVSDKAEKVLGSFLREIDELEKKDERGDWTIDIDKFGKHYGAVMRCITSLRDIAKRELRKR